MKRATLVSLVLMIPVLTGGCAVDALTWALTGFGMVSDQYRPDYGFKPEPALCVEAVHGEARGRDRHEGLSTGGESAGLSVKSASGWRQSSGLWIAFQTLAACITPIALGSTKR